MTRLIVDYLPIFASIRSESWISSVQFFALFWSFVMAACLKAKLAWGGILVAVSGALFPGALAEKRKPDAQTVDVKVPVSDRSEPFLVKFRGTVRSLLVIGGICIAIYGMYVDRERIAARAQQMQQDDDHAPKLPDQTDTEGPH